MPGWRGIVSGALALLLLEALVQPAASGRVAGLTNTIAGWGQKFLDPAVAAITAKPKHDSGSSGGGLDIGGFIGDAFNAVTGIATSAAGVPVPNGFGGTSTTPAIQTA